MSNDTPLPQPPNSPQEPQAPAPASAPPKIEVTAEPTRGAAGAGRVYDAPPPPREPPPNPFAAPPPPPSAASRPSAAVLGASGWAVACHLVGLADLGLAILLVGPIFTTALWLLRRGEDPEADFHGKESLNLQLNVLMWQVAAFPLTLCCLVGVPILLASPLVTIAMLFYGAYRASRGERWRYPFILRFVS